MSIGTQLISTKEDHKIHGFGLKSVRNTLKKYRGDFDWEYNETNHEFITTVLIKHSAD